MSGVDVINILIAVFSGVVALSTGVYAFLTWKLVSETRRMREAQTEPRVSVQLELSNQAGYGGLQLVIRNEGMGPAQDISFEVQGDLEHFVTNGIGRRIDEIPVIKDGLKHLGPDRQFTLILGWLFGEAFQRANKNPWIFHVSYKSQAGKLRKEAYVLDFSAFSHLIIGGGDPLRGIEKHLDAIQKEFGYLGTGFHKARIITQTKEEYLRELEQAQQEQVGPHRGNPAPDSEITN